MSCFNVFVVSWFVALCTFLSVLSNLRIIWCMHCTLGSVEPAQFGTAIVDSWYTNKLLALLLTHAISSKSLITKLLTLTISSNLNRLKWRWHFHRNEEVCTISTLISRYHHAVNASISIAWLERWWVFGQFDQSINQSISWVVLSSTPQAFCLCFVCNQLSCVYVCINHLSSNQSISQSIN